MKKDLSVKPVALVLLTFLFNSTFSEAATTKAPEISMTLEPAQYIYVNGDASQFRAHHWMSTEYAGGVKEFEFEDTLASGATVSMQGHAIPDNGDYATEIKLNKEDLGYLLFDYKQFRKYYGSTGGLYLPFTTIQSATTDKDLSLNIGEFSLEAGLRKEEVPQVTLNYTREFKNGTKSRLSWTGITEGPTVSGGAPDIMRKIGPSWQEITEIVDKFDVKAEDEFYGFNWHSQQGWEYVRSKNMREEQNFSTTPNPASGSNSDQKIRDQYTEPRSNLITTILGLNKWFLKNKVYLSSDYRFAQLNSRELENIIETDQNRVPTNFSNAEQVVNAHSDNLYTSNTWVGSFTSFLLNQLTFSARIKAESIGKRGESTYPKDNSPNSNNGASKPDGVVDQIDVSENQDKISNYGEGISLRYTGIPRVAIYNEYEFQQTRDNLYEDRQSISTNEQFSRQDIAHTYRGSAVLGANFSPWNWVSLTTDLRHRQDQVHYNHVRYTLSTASAAKSVFVDGQTIESDQLSSKIRLKPCKWFQPSFRYQYHDTDYDTWGLPDSDNHQESGMNSHIYTFDIVVQPIEDLLTTTSLSIQKAHVFTPARLDTTASYKPIYNADVLTALFSAEYALNKDWVMTALTQWSDAADFNNLGSSSISYGVDYTELDISLGLRYAPTKDMTVEPKYSYFRYNPSSDVELRGYNASVISLDVNFKWG